MSRRFSNGGVAEKELAELRTWPNFGSSSSACHLGINYCNRQYCFSLPGFLHPNNMPLCVMSLEMAATAGVEKDVLDWLVTS